jgi:hypothetical protein
LTHLTVHHPPSAGDATMSRLLESKPLHLRFPDTLQREAVYC